MSSLTVHPRAWTILIPVKQTTVAKSRLTGFDPATRRRFAVAFAQDTVSAAVACVNVVRVVVVTDDPVAALLRELGADIVPDRPNAGLNPALRYAAEQVRGEEAGAPIAAISSDLPSLRPSDLSAALTAAPSGRWFVPDAANVGTTMLAAAAGEEWTPRFGPGSRAAHRALGNVELQGPGLERLRADVDTAADLSDAYTRGVGAWTTEVLADLDELRLA
jgi:2-phospho-L-lactate/phosphoenolpyruvate guanylyltransferase